MTAFLQKEYFSVDEYLAIQERAVEKLEYYDGIIKTMSGGTTNHNEICAKIIIALGNAKKKAPKKFRLYTSDTKIQIEAENKFVYPDAVVVCEKPIHYQNRKDIILNPILVVEVQSKSTKKKDENDKFVSYKTIPSFEQYVLVSQDKKQVKTFLKNEDWKEVTYENTNDIIYLNSLGINILLEDIYDDIEFWK